MIISKIKIKRIAPQRGHIGFVSCIVDDCLFLNNIAIFTRLSDKNQIRLVFPEKKVGDKVIPLFHPVSSDFYYILEKEILSKLKEIYE